MKAWASFTGSLASAVYSAMTPTCKQLDVRGDVMITTGAAGGAYAVVATFVSGGTATPATATIGAGSAVVAIGGQVASEAAKYHVGCR
jgi:hypothetical protein